MVAAPAHGQEWKFDILHLRNGRSMQGLVVKETAREVVFQRVSRKPGSPTVVNTMTLGRQEVARVEPLAEADRTLLAERLRALAREREVETVLKRALVPSRESGAMETLQYESVPWVLGGKSSAIRYTSQHFVLESNARLNLVDPAVVYLEQIYSAYQRFLPPRVTDARPTMIYLPATDADYSALMRNRGRDLLNPAFYDPERNEIICASQVQTLGDQIVAVRKRHDEIRKQLADQEAEFRKLYNGKIPAALSGPIVEARQKMDRSEAFYRKTFQEAAGRQLHTLYHEAFHAYMACFVYPPELGEVPRWLNEGLAQIFESAVVEAGELRLDRLDRGRLTRVQGMARNREFVSLSELLRSGPEQFRVVHGSDRLAIDRCYLTSWALAVFLTFDRRLLDSPKLDRYVQELKRGKNELEAFQDLVGMRLPDFEKQFVQYLLELRPDGRLEEPYGSR